MILSVEQEHLLDCVKQALHDAVVRVKGGSRFTRDHRPIKPMEPKHAAEILGKTADEVRNMVDPNKPDHRMYLDQFHTLLMQSMDTVALDEIERSIGRVAITVPYALEHEDLSEELMHTIKEFGDVGRQLSEALDDGIVRQDEFDEFDRECNEAMGAIAELREAVRAKVEL